MSTASVLGSIAAQHRLQVGRGVKGRISTNVAVCMGCCGDASMTSRQGLLLYSEQQVHGAHSRRQPAVTAYWKVCLGLMPYVASRGSACVHACSPASALRVSVLCLCCMQSDRLLETKEQEQLQHHIHRCGLQDECTCWLQGPFGCSAGSIFPGLVHLFPVLVCMVISRPGSTHIFPTWLI